MKKIVIKTIEFVKKHDNIFFIILIFLSILGITMNVRIENSDELWNFQNVYKMYNGYHIYQDANVIITPLFFLIGEFLFKILGANFLTFRIYSIILFVVFYFIIYLLLKKLKISKKISVMFIILMILKTYSIIRAQANYNIMVLSIGFLGIYLYLNKYKHKSVIQGIILFVIFMTKQNMGAFYVIGLLFCEIFEENNWKEKIKNLITVFLVFLAFLMVFFIYLYNDNNLYNFINYTVLGTEEFATGNLALDWFGIIDVAFLILIATINIVLTFIFIKYKKITSMQKRQLIVLNCFSIPFILTVLPIVNFAHVFMGICLSIILLLVLISILLREVDLNINQKIINTILTVLVLFVCGYSISNFISWYQTIYSGNYKFEKSHPFYGGIYEESLIENIDKVTNYIENNSNKVIVLSSKAAFYMVPMKSSNGMLDLPFKGNLGKDGEEGVIRLLENMTNEEIEILIEKDEENVFWQESKLVRKYIIENMNKIGEIEEFEIYK